MIIIIIIIINQLFNEMEVSERFSIYLNSEITKHKTMILNHLFLQRLPKFRAKIPCELLEGK